MSTIAEALTYYDIDTLYRLVKTAHARAARAAAKNRDSGIRDTLPGADADAVRQAHLSQLLAKIEEVQEAQTPGSFMDAQRVVDPRALLEVADADAQAAVARAEDERDAAESLADSRGVFLSQALPLLDALATEVDDDDWSAVKDAARLRETLREHLRVTGEVEDAG